MPMSLPKYLPSIIASAHVFHSVSDSLEVNTSLGNPFPFILLQDCAVEVGKQRKRFGDQI